MMMEMNDSIPENEPKPETEGACILLDKKNPRLDRLTTDKKPHGVSERAI